MATVRPLDRDAIIAAARDTGAIVTVEEHTVFGGLGGAVAEVVVQTVPVPMRILGVPGVFAPTGAAEWLLEHFGLTAAGHPRRRAGARRAAGSRHDRSRSWPSTRARPTPRRCSSTPSGRIVRRASRPVPLTLPAARLGRAGRASRSGRASRTRSTNASAAADAVRPCGDRDHQPARVGRGMGARHRTTRSAR